MRKSKTYRPHVQNHKIIRYASTDTHGKPKKKTRCPPPIKTGEEALHHTAGGKQATRNRQSPYTTYWSCSKTMSDERRGANVIKLPTLNRPGSSTSEKAKDTAEELFRRPSNPNEHISSEPRRAPALEPRLGSVKSM